MHYNAYTKFSIKKKYLCKKFNYFCILLKTALAFFMHLCYN